MRFAIALAISSGLALTPARAAVPVEVTADASSTVGRILVLAIKGKVSESSTLRTAGHSEDRLQVRILAMDQFGASDGVGTSWSVAITWSGKQAPLPVFLDHRLGYCGSDRVERCSTELVGIVEAHAAAIARAQGT